MSDRRGTGLNRGSEISLEPLLCVCVCAHAFIHVCMCMFVCGGERGDNFPPQMLSAYLVFLMFYLVFLFYMY